MAVFAARISLRGGTKPGVYESTLSGRLRGCETLARRTENHFSHLPVPRDPLDGEPNYPLPTSAIGALPTFGREVPTKLMFILASHISSSTVSRSSRLCPGRGTLHFKRLHRQAGQRKAICEELWQRATWRYGFGLSGIGPPYPSSLKRWQEVGKRRTGEYGLPQVTSPKATGREDPPTNLDVRDLPDEVTVNVSRAGAYASELLPV